MKRRMLLMKLLMLFHFMVSAQYELVIQNSVSGKVEKSVTVKDSLSSVKQLQQYILNLHDQGYLIAGYDSVVYKPKRTLAYIYQGDQLKWSYLRTGNISETVLNRVNFRGRDFRNKPLQYKQIAKLERDIIKWSENNGLPFASIQLDSLSFTENKLSSTLKWDKGPLIYFDSIRIEGKIKAKRKFLTRQFKIYKNNLYEQDRIDQLNIIMREMPYLVSLRPPMVTFRDNKATVTLFLKDKKISSADGIIGFLPNEGSSKRLLVTGELNLNLRNLFGTGKTLQVEWKKIKEQTQTLEANYVHPKLLGSPLDVRFNFSLFKQDSSFLTVNRKLTFSNRVGKFSKVNFLGGLKTSRMLSTQFVDTSKLRFSDYNHYAYGIGYEFNNTDDLYYPHRGWNISMQATLGNKIINKNAEIAESYYNDIRLNSLQWNIECNAERYTKLGKKSVLLNRIQLAQLFNDVNNIFLNDLYRIGGLRTLRGFNENTFFASQFAIATMEYRFYMEETSYLLAFVDQGYWYSPVNEVRKSDSPLGFGAGLSFATQAGVFNFVYSLGRSADTKISLNLSKIHFGITSRF